MAALRSLCVLDTPPDERFDTLVRLASLMFKMPISYVSFVDSDRQWLKARVGITPCETARDVAFCSFAILEDRPFFVPDTRADSRFSNNPLVVGDPFLGSYFGVPLKVGGFNVGTLCLADHEPRTLSETETEALVELANVAARELGLRELVDTQTRLLEAQREKELLFDQLQQEKQRADRFLLSLMPGDIAEELSTSGKVEPRYFHDVTVLFTDFVGFSRQTEVLAAEELVELLNRYFSAFDDIVARYGLEKLKTIGDSYMCVGGMPESNASHPVDAVLAAMEMRNVIREVARNAEPHGISFDIRIGLHTGPVVAGVVGTRRFAYDIWGETVNLASRMESSGAPGCINLSERTFARVKDFFQCEHRGRVTTKDHQEREMYFVRDLQNSLKSASDEPGVPPQFQRRYNTYFRKPLQVFPRLDVA